MEKVSETIKELLVRMGFNDTKVVEQDLGSRVKVDIQTDDGRELIGEKGLILSAFQHIVRRIINHNVVTPVVLDIDVNGYKKMREGVLREFAQEIREKVNLRGGAVELDPMPPFDRRVVHLALADFSDVTTESVGEGEERYIIVRPHP